MRDGAPAFGAVRRRLAAACGVTRLGGAGDCGADARRNRSVSRFHQGTTPDGMGSMGWSDGVRGCVSRLSHHSWNTNAASMARSSSSRSVSSTIPPMNSSVIDGPDAPQPERANDDGGERDAYDAARWRPGPG